jgi:hypothetical protein
MAKHHYGANEFHDAITGVAATSSSHLVTKAQLDAVANGKFYKDAVRVVATSNVDIAGGGLANGQTIDGETLATGERVLLTGQTTASQNGVYVVPASGAASRSADMAAGAASAGFTFIVTEGTTYADTKWYVASDKGADIVGTDNLTISQDTTGGSYTADEATLQLVGSEFSIKDGGVGTTQLASNAVTTAKITDANVTADKLASDAVTTAKILDANVTTAKLADGAVTTAKITDSNVTTAKIADANVTTAKIADSNVTTAKIADSNVTTGKLADGAVTTAKITDANVTTAKVADGAITAAKLASECKGYEADVGDGAATSFNVDHSLNTRKVHVTVYDNSTYTTAECVVTRSTVNRVVVDFGGYTPSSNEFHVLITPWL